MLKNLQEAQPLIVLASLSLVLAAFSQNVSEAAVIYSVAASVAFLTALWLTVFNPPKWNADPLTRIPWSAAAIVATYAGLLLLTFIVAEYAAKFSVAGDINKALSFVLSAFVEVVVVGIVWRNVGRIEKQYPRYLASRPLGRALLWFSKWGALGTGMVALGLNGAGYVTTIFPAWTGLGVFWVPWVLAVYVWRVLLRAGKLESPPQPSPT